MNKLIIITGVSGTGKTTLANTLYKKLENSTMLSFDILSENIYDLVGFKDKSQKHSLCLINTEFYKILIENCMQRNDKFIIVEKPFTSEWNIFFDRLSKKYKYKVYTINVFAKNFEIIWKRLLKREFSKNRHPSHYLKSYYFRNKDNYIPYFEYDYETFKAEYDSLIYNSINLGTIIKVNDIEELDINKLINKL